MTLAIHTHSNLGKQVINIQLFICFTRPLHLKPSMLIDKTLK